MDGIMKFPKEKEEKPKIFDKKISFKFKTLMQIVLVLVIAGGFFCLGRYYLPAQAPSTLTDETLPNATAELNDQDQTPDSPLTVTQTTPDNNTNESELSPTPEEKFVTSNYQDVDLVIKDINFEWNENWGKITKIYYTIINGEDGTVQPKYFEFIMDGYEYPKVFDVPLLDQKVPKDTNMSGAVSFTFTYNENQIDPANADITLKLLDSSNTTLTFIQKTFDLTE